MMGSYIIGTGSNTSNTDTYKHSGSDCWGKDLHHGLGPASQARACTAGNDVVLHCGLQLLSTTTFCGWLGRNATYSC